MSIFAAEYVYLWQIKMWYTLWRRLVNKVFGVFNIVLSILLPSPRNLNIDTVYPQMQLLTLQYSNKANMD